MGIWKNGTKYCDECGKTDKTLHVVKNMVKKDDFEMEVCGKCLRNLIKDGWILIIGK